MRPLIVVVLLCALGGAHGLGQAFNMTIHDCALQYSAASHCSDASLYNWSCPHCLPLPGFVVTDIAYDALDNIRGFVGVAAANRTVVVSFRGTVGDRNWLEDGDAHQVQLPDAPPGVLVHQGFLDTYRSVRKRVVAAVLQAQRSYPADNLLVTGHSLGGALAALCMLDLTAQNVTASYRTVWLYNYGQPRVGNPAYAAYYAAQVGANAANFRVVNKRDPIPHLPPQQRTPFFHGVYQHAPVEVWYHGVPPRYQICSSTDGEDPNCSDGVRDWDPLEHATYMGVEMSC